MTWLALLLMLALPALAQAQLAIGIRVQTTQVTAVRDAPGGTSLGLQPIGAQGLVLAGPQAAWGFQWWQIHYDAGLDGWSTDDRLAQALPAVPPGAATAPVITIRNLVSWILSWFDTSTTETGFEIERGLTPAGPFTFLARVPENALTYEDRAVTLGTRYCYRVRAINAASPSAYTPIVCTP